MLVETAVTVLEQSAPVAPCGPIEARLRLTQDWLSLSAWAEPIKVSLRLKWRLEMSESQCPPALRARLTCHWVLNRVSRHTGPLLGAWGAGGGLERRGATCIDVGGCGPLSVRRH